MNAPLLSSNLQCPFCRNDVIVKKQSVSCTTCSGSFPVINSVPFFSPQASASDIALSQKRWDGLYKDERITSSSPMTDKTVASYVSFLMPYLKKMKKGTLDLGCGIAWTGYALARKDIPLTGIDISHEAVLKSQALFHARRAKGSFIQGDLTALPFRDESFPFIYSCMSLEYVKHTDRALRESFRVLEKKGTMIAIVPVVSLTTLTYHQTRGDIPGIPVIKQVMELLHIRLLRGRYMKYGFEQTFTVGSLRKLFLHAGFTVNTIDFFPMYYPLAFLPESWQAPARRLLHHRLFWPLVYIEAVKR